MVGALVTSGPVGWHGDWEGKRAVVVGGGDVGFSLADTLHELGVPTTLVTDTPDADQERILGVLGVAVVADRGEQTALPAGGAADIVVLACPAMRSHPLTQVLGEAGARVWSEVEFSLRVADKTGVAPRVVFLAGHTHADEVASLAALMCHEEGIKAVTVGTVGETVLDVLRDPAGWDVLLWPLGSAELHDLHFDTDPLRAPFVAVGLDADETVDGSALEALYFRTEHACVYTRGGGSTEQAVERAWVEEGCRAIGVGLDTPGMSDLGIVDDIICDRAFLDDRRDRALELTTLGELEAVGVSSPDRVVRAVTACAIARAVGVSAESIGVALRRADYPPE